MTDTNRYPGRLRRTHKVAELAKLSPGGEVAVLCGRVIGLIDGEAMIGGKEVAAEKAFVLQDDSGRLNIACAELPKVGMIIEVSVINDGRGRFLVQGEIQILADCEDFYISPQASPNYKKMAIDESFRSTLLKRSRVVAAIREFFAARGFADVETPCLVRLPGMEPYLDVFKTRFEADFSADQKLNEDMYLITSPEYAMKKLLVGGLEKIFQITRSFRNKETFSERHNPEFTILEWYRAYASYLEIMTDTEELVKFVWEKIGEKSEGKLINKMKWGNVEIDIGAPWKRLRVLEAFRLMAEIDEETFFNLDKFRQVVRSRGYVLTEGASFDDCFYSIFLNEIEPKLGLGVPTILYDYPVSMAALSKRCEDDDRFAERFEAYIGGVEICNAFTELNDPVEQERRLTLEKEERRAAGKELYDVDKTFIDALKFGMPPSGGNALGVDRLVMLILGERDIRNVLLFPHRDL